MKGYIPSVSYPYIAVFTGHQRINSGMVKVKDMQSIPRQKQFHSKRADSLVRKLLAFVKILSLAISYGKRS